MKKDQVLDYMDSLEKEDEGLESYVKMYEALSSFLTDFGHADEGHDCSGANGFAGNRA